MTSNKSVSRISVKLSCPNPLFEKWLTEWKEQAKEKNLKTQHAYNIALQSLRKFPLPLESGRDCKILKGFGNKLCQQLDDALKNYKTKKKSQDTENDNNYAVHKPSKSSVKLKNLTEVETHSKSKRNEYIPKYKSGSYALLVALYKEGLNGNNQKFMFKQHLIRASQPYCDTSFTKSEPGTFYSAWNSMTKLITENLVKKESCPAKYSLTDKGMILAQKLYIKHFSDNSDDAKLDCINNREGRSSFEQIPHKPSSEVCLSDDTNSLDCFNVEQIIESNNVSIYEPVPSASAELKGICGEFNSETIEKTTEKRHGAEIIKSSTDFENVIFAPHSFDIILYVDTCETSGALIDPSEDAILAELKHLNVTYEVKNIKVGDYCWICRDRVSKIELLLPYIIERKRMDDFARSIKDGRFHEQKFRLKQCGLPNVIYMIESFGKKDEHVGLPITSLYQAATNTLIQDGFFVKFVEGPRGVAEYLACLANLITTNYKNKTIFGCPKEDLSSTSITEDLVSLMLFTEFNKLSAKTRVFTVKEMFIRQLLQINGMSIDKALAIVEVYPTPQFLKTTLENDLKCANNISNIKYGKLGKKIGPLLSNIICQLFTKISF